MYNNAINGINGTSYYEQYLMTGNRYRYATDNGYHTNRMISAMLSARWNIDKKTLLNISGSFNALKVLMMIVTGKLLIMQIQS